MNPWSMILADLRSLRRVGAVVVLLVAVAVAVGIALGAQERAFRRASAAAADDFALVVGAPGSPMQLVLSTVYLRLEALPLMPGEELRRLGADARVAAVAPIAFGDVVHGHPVIGTTAEFASRWGRLAPIEGRLFAAEGEAVVGAAATIAVGESFSPSHGLVGGGHHALGEEDADEAAHVHGETRHTVVGRLPATGGPWDRAVLVPVESVWETHGLGNGHAGEDHIGAPFDAASLPRLPALVVKPKSFAAAYQLRAEMKGRGLAALFPAEVLVELHQLIGDVGEILKIASAVDDGLVFLAVTTLFVTIGGLRRRRYATLRALGAPRGFILATVWGGAAILVAIGCLGGLALGWAGARLVSAVLTAQSGLVVPVRLETPDFLWAGAVFLAGSLFALAPAILAGRGRIVDGLAG